MYRLLKVIEAIIICLISLITMGGTNNFAYSQNKLFINEHYVYAKEFMYTENDINYVKVDLLKYLGIEYDFSEIELFDVEIYKFGKKAVLVIDEKIVSNNAFEKINLKNIKNELYIAVKELKKLNSNLNIEWFGDYKLVWITDENNKFAKEDIIYGNSDLFNIKNIDGVVEPVNSNKIAYLTFDDGPSSKVTPAILDTLKEYNVKATFFVNGVNIKGNEEVLKRIVSEGHTIGNHTYSHKVSLYDSLDNFKQEINSTNELIYTITGVKCQAFRPPYGYNLRQSYKDFLASQGIITYYWNVDPGDSTSKNLTSEGLIAKVRSQVANKNGDVIIILHDMNNKVVTQNAVRGIIKECWSKGFKISNLKSDVKYNGTARVF